MQTRIYRGFQSAEASERTFLGKLSAVLDAAKKINIEDPSLAKFIGVVRTDVRRYPEVAERLAVADTAREDFFVDLVEVGVSTGEVRRDDVPAVRDVHPGDPRRADRRHVGVAGPSTTGDRQRHGSLLRGQLVQPVDD